MKPVRHLFLLAVVAGVLIVLVWHLFFPGIFPLTPPGYKLPDNCISEGGEIVEGRSCPEGSYDIGFIYSMDCICVCCKEGSLLEDVLPGIFPLDKD
jgi:hypothetical protein